MRTKKQFVVFLILIFVLGLTPIKFSNADDLASKLKGKILLQVESHGEAWYVNPTTGNRHYLADGNSAYNIMRDLGVGITNKNLDRIKKDKNFAKKFSGKIFLQVEEHGEAFYVDSNGIIHYLKDGAAAYSVMRNLGLGITNSNLEKVPTIQNSKDKERGIITSKNINNQENNNIKENSQSSIVDVCKNLAGIQTELPAGMIINSDNNCVFPPQSTAQVKTTEIKNYTSCQISLSHLENLEDIIDSRFASGHKTFFAFEIDTNQAVKLNSLKINQDGPWSNLSYLHLNNSVFDYNGIVDEQKGYISFENLNIKLEKGKNLFKFIGNINQEDYKISHVFKINTSSQMDFSYACSITGLPIETTIKKIKPDNPVVSLDVVKSNDSQSGYFNTPEDPMHKNYCSDTYLNHPSASFDFHARGDDIKVKQLGAVLSRSNKSDPIDSDYFFTVYMDGTQIGTTQNIKEGDENALWSDGAIFSFGSTLIIPKDQTKKITIIAHIDHVWAQNGDSYKIILLKGNGNVQEMLSLNTLNTDGAMGNLVEVKRIPCQ